MVGTSKSVLTNSIPLMSKSSRAILAKSRVFHFPSRTSSTKAHWAREMSSLVMPEMALAWDKLRTAGPTVPAAPSNSVFSINFLRPIGDGSCFIFLRLLLKSIVWILGDLGIDFYFRLWYRPEVIPVRPKPSVKPAVIQFPCIAALGLIVHPFYQAFFFFPDLPPVHVIQAESFES